MARTKAVYFVINLLQDVNIVRGVAYLAAREAACEIAFLVSQGFFKRDTSGVWQRELGIMADDLQAGIYLYENAEQAAAALAGREGMIFAASESSLPAHGEVATVFQAASADYLRVTLQHGFECVGFVQSREHVISHGRDVSFGADVVCSWLERPALTSLVASERAKIYCTGPSLLLQRPPRRGVAAATGMVCENMHSVRLRATGDHKASFMEIFFDFCRAMHQRGQQVTLRPHPGGQYVVKNKVGLPDNVVLNNAPIFRVDLSSYSYGISAPSSIVIDMVLAGIPVGLWRDPGGIMDARNYEGLTEISTLEDWLAFERDVRLRPSMIMDRQAGFLAQQAMPLDPAEVYRRFARLIVAGLSAVRGRPAVRPAAASSARRGVFAKGRIVEAGA